MTDKELIKQEIERLKNEQLSIFSKGESVEICGTALDYIGIYNQMLSFIDSLPEEPTSEDTCLLGHDYKNRNCENCSFELCKRFSKPVNEDLEEEIDRYYSDWQFDDDTIYEDMRNICRHFAEWQKQKMMRDAVEAEVFTDYNRNFGYGSLTANIDLDEHHLKEGDKVKIIIVKEEQ